MLESVDEKIDFSESTQARNIRYALIGFGTLTIMGYILFTVADNRRKEKTSSRIPVIDTFQQVSYIIPPA